MCPKIQTLVCLFKLYKAKKSLPEQIEPCMEWWNYFPFFHPSFDIGHQRYKSKTIEENPKLCGVYNLVHGYYASNFQMTTAL